MLKPAAAALIVIIAAGCTHRGVESRGGTVPTVSCGNRRLTVVTNNWSEPVEVFTRIPASPTEQYLGTVGPGAREQFRLPETARAALVHPQNAAGATRIPGLSMVDIRYLCE